MVSNFCRLPIACRVVVITLLMTLGVHAPAHAESVGIAAIVGDQVITTTDVRERRDLLMATASIPATEENRRAITPRIIQALIDETLQLQEAKNQSLVVSDEELKKAIDSLGPRSDGKESLRSFITSNNLSMRSFENQLRAQLAWNKVVQRKLRRNVSIASDEVERARKAVANAPGEAMLTI